MRKILTPKSPLKIKRLVFKWTKKVKLTAPKSKKMLGPVLAVIILAGLIVVGSIKTVKTNQLASPGLEHQIEVLEDTFSPQEITISKGDRVTFINKTGSPIWPASDPHPTHQYVLGFDPKKPIEPGGKWGYTFNDEGSWRYHDHIALLRQGKIVVKSTNNNDLASSKTGYGENCDGKCFDEKIRVAVKEKGIEAAYKVFTDEISQGKPLPRNCHWTAHRIGETAFIMYEQGRKLNIANETSYCGFGFYHGFLEGFLRKYPDTSNIMKFCGEVTEKLGKMGYYNCVHGIGHGQTEDPPPPETFGKPDEMLKPGIAVCEKLFGKEFSNLNLCLTGVYTVLVKFAYYNEYGLTWNKADPFAFCRTQPYRYQKACYGEYAPKMDAELNWDFAKFGQLVNTISDDKTRRLVTWVISSVFTSKDLQDDIKKDVSDKYVEGCRQNFDDKLRKVCWGGILLGLYTNAEPEKQYLKAFSFCNSSKFSAEEKDLCFAEVVREAKQFYFPAKFNEVCREIPKLYQKYCSIENIPTPYDDPIFE